MNICQLTYIIGPAKLFTQFRLDMVKKTDVSADGALTIKLFQFMYYSKFGSKQSKSKFDKKLRSKLRFSKIKFVNSNIELNHVHNLQWQNLQCDQVSLQD